MTEQEFGRGVLHPAVQAGVATLTRPDPSPRLAGFVEFYWHVSWDARDRPYETKVLSHPNVHLVFEDPEPTVYGVDRGLFVRRLEGVGQVLGVKFLPGGFRPLADGPVVRLRDRRVPAAEYFGPEVEAVGRVVRTATDLSQAVMAVEAFLDPLLPARPDPAAVEVAGIVERLVADPGVVRVDQAAAVAGVSVRALQRLFAEYVGASPKWVLRRARLQEAAARADSGDAVDWASLAADLGYADQAHLTRDFTAVVGDPPGRYVRSRAGRG
ncbi:MAG TPA: helix-turn-helix domain-containing protein [Jiangellaceae bacterium]